MGYTTCYSGVLHFNKEPSKALITAINDFANMRHEYSDCPGIWCDWVIGKELKEYGECNYNAVCPYNQLPSVEKKFEAVSDEIVLGWDGVEKFYKGAEWLQYIIDNIIEPNFPEYKLNGQLSWQGEEDEDTGTISVTDNIVSIQDNGNRRR